MPSAISGVKKISWGEDFNVITLDYNWKDWQFGAGILMPFGKNVKVTEARNPQWGRQKRGANKLVDVDANTDRSTAGGR